MARLSFRCDEELLAAVDRARGDVPRELWLRKTVQREVDRAGSNSRAVEQALVDAEPRSRKLPSEGEPLDGRRSSSPAPAEQPVTQAEAEVRESEPRSVEEALTGVRPYRQGYGPNVQNVRSSSQSKRDVRPIPKQG